MLAEIFMLRLETAMRAAKEPAVKEVVANGGRFVPITLPAKTRVLRSRRKQPPIKEGWRFIIGTIALARRPAAASPSEGTESVGAAPDGLLKMGPQSAGAPNRSRGYARTQRPKCKAILCHVCLLASTFLGEIASKDRTDRDRLRGWA